MSRQSPTPRAPSAASRKRKLLWIGLSILAVALTPVVVHEALRWEHSRGFQGTCGPHAPDIAAHPCSYEEYMAEFGAGFAGVGLLLIEAASVVLAAGVVAAFWSFASWKMRQRQPSDDSNG
jgi:hypothetical protein